MFSLDVKDSTKRDIFKEELNTEERNTEDPTVEEHECDDVLQCYAKIWNSVSPNKLSKSPNL